ncbi:MAG: PQQ-like beta-propeller repeat protein, partial [Methanomicrobiales archaeon]|nr:PQQ-like beta-propeller repeat protein [Methanomicrobiales archaeon]
MHATGLTGRFSSTGTGYAVLLLLLLTISTLLVFPAGAASVTGKLLWAYTAENDIVDVAATPEGDEIVAAILSNNILLLDGDGTLTWTYLTQSLPLAVGIAPGGDRVVVGTQDGSVAVHTGR